MRHKNISKTLQERFGDPIGSYAGDAPVGVRSEMSAEPCPHCGMLPIGGRCGCEQDCGCGGSPGECSCERGMNEAVDFGPCPDCGMLPVDGHCNCTHGKESCSGCGNSPEMCTCQVSRLGMYEGTEPCDECGMYEVEGSCGCTHMEEAQSKGPSKKTAKKILRGTKTFADKMKKVSGWADEPAAAAAWMMHKATGKWPSEK